jgi:hypothetical protein
MAISGSGEPEAGQELNLAREAPSPPAYEPPLERLEFEAGAGDVMGRISLGVRGDLRPAAHVLVATVCSVGAAFAARALCELEGVHAVITLIISALVAVIVWRACCTFLRRK